jgi:hypothetical protein
MALILDMLFPDFYRAGVLVVRRRTGNVARSRDALALYYVTVDVQHIERDLAGR